MTTTSPEHTTETPRDDTAQAPFFIVGCARTGTTLLRTMLNHHPRVAVPLESIFLIDYLRADGRVPVATMRELMAGEVAIEEWGMTISYSDLDGCQTTRDLIDRIHELYMTEHGKDIWGQKTPRFIRHGALFKQVYPNAKFIHVLRDPRATVNSLIRSNVHNSNPYFAAKRWLKDVRAGQDLKAVYPDDVLEIRYEDLVTNTEQTLRRVTDFLGLDYAAEMLTYYETGQAEYSDFNKKIQARLVQPPNPDRIHAWKKSLTPQQIALVEHICGETMQAFGYTPEPDLPPVSTHYIRMLKLQRFVGLTKQILHYLTTRRRYFLQAIARKRKLGLITTDIKEINY